MLDAGARLENAVFLIESGAVTNSRPFGSGFSVARDGEATLLITCAHVIAAVGGPDQVRVQGLDAVVLACGDAGGNDLAILRVAGLTAPALLDRHALGQTQAAVQLCGYAPL